MPAVKNLDIFRVHLNAFFNSRNSAIVDTYRTAFYHAGLHNDAHVHNPF